MGVDHKTVAPFHTACTMTACYSSAIYINKKKTKNSGSKICVSLYYFQVILNSNNGKIKKKIKTEGLFFIYKSNTSISSSLFL